MNDGFRQRLVGAIVLTCLALILWPIIFSNSSQPFVDRSSQIPPMPQFEKYTVPSPQKPETVESVSTDVVASSKPAPASRKTSETAKKQNIALDQRGLPQSWVLQVASFSQEKNAESLVSKLKKRSYKAFLTTDKRDGKALSRVFIGPKFKKSELEKARLDVDKTYKVKSLIVRHEP